MWIWMMETKLIIHGWIVHFSRLQSALNCSKTASVLAILRVKLYEYPYR